MDVILDSNAYISDIRMESIRFKNLFDYLHRTKSCLVLPRLVREEMIAKYRKLLDEQAQKAGKAIKELNRLIFKKASQIHYSAPKSAYAAREVRQKFRELEKAGVVRYYPETVGIDVGDVFLRGVKRRRPANAEGEELRDVIIWLVALQYAETEKKPIAFVTADGGFWNEAGVHEHLAEDIDQRKVNISLFHSIDDFIKDSAPKSSPADEAYVLKFFDVTSVRGQITNAVRKELSNSKRLLLQSFTVQSIESISLKFSSGTIYEIDPETKFMELSYDAVFAAHVEFVEQSFPSTFGIGGLRAPFGGIGSPLSLAAPINVFEQQREFMLALNSGRAVLQTAPANRVVKGYAVSAKAQISIRVVKGTVTENELDRVEINKVEEMARAVAVHDP